MFTIKNSFEFIADIKVLDERLKNIRINSIEIDRKAYKIKYNFVCDKAIDDELQQKILRIKTGTIIVTILLASYFKVTI